VEQLRIGERRDRHGERADLEGGGRRWGYRQVREDRRHGRDDHAHVHRTQQGLDAPRIVNPTMATTSNRYKPEPVAVDDPIELRLYPPDLDPPRLRQGADRPVVDALSVDEEARRNGPGSAVLRNRP
jgi:hypothetical protein